MLDNMQKNIQKLAEYGIHIDEITYQNNSKQIVAVGMSGGVDSSVSAALIKMMGYKTLGIFMRNWEEIGVDGVCSAEEDYQDVIAVCEKLDIEYYALNFSKEYEQRVFSDFLTEYKNGHTPNPDILCNREIKFDVFLKQVKSLGANFLATGHYCQNLFLEDRFQLVKGVDSNKDQTYFLYALKKDVLKNVLFPIGHLEKRRVRELACELDLITKEKKDSTGICFIGERDFKKFLSQYIESQKGYFYHLETNEQLIPHDGACFYTIGQRKGLGIGGPGGPWFVAKKDLAENKVFVVEGESHPALYADSLTASEETWINEAPQFPLKCKAKIRYRQKDQECLVKRNDDGELEVYFVIPQRAISLSQSIVFYLEDICLGGAIIKDCGLSYFEQKKELPTTRA